MKEKKQHHASPSIGTSCALRTSGTTRAAKSQTGFLAQPRPPGATVVRGQLEKKRVCIAILSHKYNAKKSTQLTKRSPNRQKLCGKTGLR
jgi:hypothetical protein